MKKVYRWSDLTWIGCIEIGRKLGVVSPLTAGSETWSIDFIHSVYHVVVLKKRNYSHFSPPVGANIFLVFLKEELTQPQINVPDKVGQGSRTQQKWRLDLMNPIIDLKKHALFFVRYPLKLTAFWPLEITHSESMPNFFLQWIYAWQVENFKCTGLWETLTWS